MATLKQPKKTPDPITVEAAAELIGCTTGRVRQLLRSGLIQGKKFGERAWLVNAESARAYRFAESRQPRFQNS